MIPRTPEMEAGLALNWSHAFLSSKGGALLVRLRRKECDDIVTCFCAATPFAVTGLLDVGYEILDIDLIPYPNQRGTGSSVQKLRAIDWVISAESGVGPSLAVETASGRWFLPDPRADLDSAVARHRLLTREGGGFKITSLPVRH